MVASEEVAGNPFALEPLWLRICEQSGSTFASHYLAVGLLGLRMLPEREGNPSERPWMTGLMRWAICRVPSIDDFSQQWWALKGLYPRMPSYWRVALKETLQQYSAKQMPDELKDWWQQDVGAKDGTTAQQPQSQPVAVPKLSPLSYVQLLRRRAVNPLPSIRKQIENVIHEQRHYAEVTGESHYLVTTACNIGMAVIKGADDPIGRGLFAIDLARQALAWQPANVYAWALWRDALAKQGAFEAAELVGWEAIHRFPEDVQWRTQLALLFADQPDRESDAEQLLHETVSRFPDNVVARNQLAELLIALDRTSEATSVVDANFPLHLEDEASFDLRARLLYHSGDVEAAREVLHSGLGRFASNPILQAHLRMLDGGRPLPLKAAASRTDAATPETSATIAPETEVSVGITVRQRGRLRRLFSEYRRRQVDDSWRSGALEEVQHILSEDPNLAYAKYLNQELEGRDEDGSVGGSFTIAFIDAVKLKDANRLAQLEKSFSGQGHLVDVAKAFLFGDLPAADGALAWLKQQARSEPRTVSALRGFLHQRFDISSVASGEAFVKLAAGDDNLQTDLIESALAGDEFLLAA